MIQLRGDGGRSARVAERLPVPGTGKYECGPNRRLDLPSEYNAERGWIATANNATQPRDFTPPDAYEPPTAAIVVRNASRA